MAYAGYFPVEELLTLRKLERGFRVTPSACGFIYLTANYDLLKFLAQGFKGVSPRLVFGLVREWHNRLFRHARRNEQWFRSATLS